MARNRRRRRRGGSRGYGKVLLGVLIGVALISGLGAYGEALERINPANERDESPASSENSSEALYFSISDAKFMNRIFRERNHEVAYCGYVLRVENTWLKPWLADTINASPHSIQFSIANCQGGTNSLMGTIHTHPSGNQQLSERDRATLMTQKQNVMCIQSGRITTQIGEPAADLSCYETAHLNGKVQIAEVPVVVGSSPEGGDTWE